ncbi:MAG TPA: 4Fe-4S binding protein [Burkholderiales bacterium]|nr:4Fe-4S binding protein [Burkholderiales bacterium]
MSLEGKTLKVCSCNRTMAVDAKALAAALKSSEPIVVHHELCRKDAAAFSAALGEPDVIVACTQEAPLFSELAAGSHSNLRFVNVREHAGWSPEGARATPKIAALVAMAALPDPEPAPAVEFKSGGNLLIIGPAAAALDWAERLSGQLEVSVLVSGKGELPLERKFPLWSGKATSVKGWLGAFEVEWQQENPIDLELCTRCNACVRACPESAIDYGYQVDMEKCKAHRDCVAACGAIGAIDFSRAAAVRKESFDLVLDLSRQPLLRMHQLPQGYLAPGDDPLEQALAAQQLAAMVGEFEKPRFFQYREKICAHSRAGQPGCNLCIEVCSSDAIRPDGDYVKVEPHLCAGCGGCATVCPSGAMSYAYPRMPDLGMRLKTLLATYREAGGKDACILIHDAADGRAALLSNGRKGKGLPARVIPFEVFHVASVGMDLLLGVIAYGASQVRILTTEKIAETYVAALKRQMGYAQQIVTGLGYEGEHFSVMENLSMLWEASPAAGVAKPATFNFSPEKRTTLDFAIEHLASQKTQQKQLIEMTAGAPFGAITVNKATCTLCKACIGACPEAALLDSPEAPRLRFIERNCVQCGLCAATCPEDAISLTPRLILGAQAKEAVTLNEAEPFNCVRCGKPFGTRQMVENMLGKLGGHSMFAGGTRRLQMCGDCRVVDMMDNSKEATIFDVRK